MKIKHIDLFSGIGGFAYAIDQVFGEAEHLFCDNNNFCQAVLKKHWPQSKIYGDIKKITEKQLFADSGSKECGRRVSQEPRQESVEAGDIHILTGGFPCQPFSQAGKRRGTEDNRYLWPEMFRIIQLANPDWVVAENVRGLTTWNDGMVLEQVCSDLESQGYEVQPIIIPACATNAPHRRERVWIIANRAGDRRERERAAVQTEKGLQSRSGKAGELEGGT